MQDSSDSKDCKYYDECDAPVCPLDKHSLNTSIWYSDEDICRLREFSGVLWIKNQRKIKKRQISSDTYFTSEMLDRKLKVSQGMKGIDPDNDSELGDESIQWLERHQPYKERKVHIRSLEALKKASHNRH